MIAGQIFDIAARYLISYQLVIHFKPLKNNSFLSYLEALTKDKNVFGAFIAQRFPFIFFLFLPGNCLSKVDNVAFHRA